MSRKRGYKFVSNLRGAFSGHPTLDTVWSWLFGDSIPEPKQRQILIDHLNSLGWEVSTRDFVRGAAASNHPQLILLRMLRNKLSRNDLEQLLFGKGRLDMKGTSNVEPQA